MRLLVAPLLSSADDVNCRTNSSSARSFRSANRTDKTLTYRGAAGGGLQRATENSGEDHTQKILARRNTTHGRARCSVCHGSPCEVEVLQVLG